MEFTDLNGNKIIVYKTQLDEAIRQTEYFTTLSDPSATETKKKKDAERKLYWEDMLQKLKGLKNDPPGY